MNLMLICISCSKAHRFLFTQFHYIVYYIILMIEATAIREYCCHQGMYLVCNNVGTCQSTCPNSWYVSK